jgi:DNA-binding PadR family transcriptional regulator
MNDYFEYLPLTQAMFHILLSLLDGDKHGYAIKKEIESISNQTINLGPGALYGSINKLCDLQFITEVKKIDDDPGEHSRQNRRYYSITPSGKKVLNAELDRLNKALVIARQKKKYSHP